MWFGCGLCGFLLLTKPPLGWFPQTPHGAPPLLWGKTGPAHTLHLQYSAVNEEQNNKLLNCQWKHDSIGRFKHILLKECVLTFVAVKVSTAVISHIDINGSAMRWNVQGTIWTICRAKQTSLFFTKKLWSVPAVDYCVTSRPPYLWPCLHAHSSPQSCLLNNIKNTCRFSNLCNRL